jgi:hypothetical protein
MFSAAGLFGRCLEAPDDAIRSSSANADRQPFSGPSDVPGVVIPLAARVLTLMQCLSVGPAHELSGCQVSPTAGNEATHDSTLNMANMLVIALGPKTVDTSIRPGSPKFRGVCE